MPTPPRGCCGGCAPRSQRRPIREAPGRPIREAPGRPSTPARCRRTCRRRRRRRSLPRCRAGGWACPGLPQRARRRHPSVARRAPRRAPAPRPRRADGARRDRAAEAAGAARRIGRLEVLALLRATACHAAELFGRRSRRRPRRQGADRQRVSAWAEQERRRAARGGSSSGSSGALPLGRSRAKTMPATPPRLGETLSSCRRRCRPPVDDGVERV